MGLSHVALIDKYAGSRSRVRRPASPRGHLWWDRLRGAISLGVARRRTARGAQGTFAAPCPRQRVGEGRVSARAPFPSFFRQRPIEWSPLRAALDALADHQP